MSIPTIKKNEMMDNIPLLLGKITKKLKEYNVIEVWCPYCKCNHIHGVSKTFTKDDITHRNAHCDFHNENSFKKTGYYIGLH